ncbi:glutathione S-transferase N-terminal domain-containing protein [Pseudomonas berkeleyensis]|uniref:Glutathione S-transferase N-terminal domain-containing protein n=1 Tax=Pseudomonas berkeleyensis TaxID=2726956 RepID=A0A7G5DQD5_9PSED|nr:glutathione S-transferase N-terminal domain-containing protein [Pseudomonas berkeleyensis]QMV63960.1 glutathione S-transferase N-terminal domain-containing protein [Pseudomonas berkeleyensis]WSO39425.1 glutathione S-transferase N-terminal domain-containing protein [Pseudomonas berkeleyensis]
MIDLYYWTTPNGHKVSIFLEEAGLDYRVIPVHIGKGEQFEPEFLKIAPNNRIPAIVDQAPADAGEPIALFESGAILEYLADKSGLFLPRETRARFQVLQWLYWQMGGVGPMAGQNHHFVRYAPEPIPYAIERYVKETARLYGVLDRQLAEHEYVAGDYSIADMAIYPWATLWQAQQQKIENFPHMAAWLERIAARPAVQRAYALVAQVNEDPKALLTAEARRLLFGQ